MSRNPIYSAEQMMEATLRGFHEVKKAIESVQEVQKIQAKATYDGLTGSGKGRYVSRLVEEYGSQAAVARTLGLTPGRISQLVNSDSNRKNGK